MGAPANRPSRLQVSSPVLSLTNPLLLPFSYLLFILFSLLVYAVTTHLTHTRRHPSSAFAWVLLLVLVPYIGLPAYLLLGLRKYARPLPRHRHDGGASAGPSHWASSTLAGLGLLPPQNNCRVILHNDGTHALHELDRLIDSARHTLDICTYVLSNDAVAHHTARLLGQAAARGVRVRLLIDAAGSWRVSHRLLRRMRASGVEVRLFTPLLHNPMRGRINLRNHRKIAVADGFLLWTGGRNIAQEYFLPRKGKPAWIDLSLTIEGALAREAQQIFHANWRRHRGHSNRHPTAPLALHAAPALPPPSAAPAALSSAPSPVPSPPPAPVSPPASAPMPAPAAAPPHATTPAPIPTHPTHPTLTTPPTPAPQAGTAAAPPAGTWEGHPWEGHWAQLVPSGPDLADDTVLSLLLTGLYQAERRIWAATPYFVPDDSLLAALRLAAVRGVEVNLLMPRRSNHRLADIVRQQPLRDFAAAGGRIHLLDDMMHAKAIIIDDTLALTGSLNLDARSLFLNFELMIALYSPRDIAALQAWIDRLAARARPYTPPSTSLPRDIAEGLVRWLGFQI